MKKNVYFVRHAEAEGQAYDARLTDRGQEQASHLSAALSGVSIDRIISSPFLRAVQTAGPLAEKRNLEIEIDERLSERVLGSGNLPDWLGKLESSFTDLEVKLEGGESSREAMTRGTAVVEDALKSDEEHILLVTHGNLMSLMIKHYQPEFGFEDWKKLGNPDVFLLKVNGDAASLSRIWENDKLSV
ncbi:2,3-bisphosphoglycerate-dependent phosphoglycerate mutase [Bacillus sp. OV322]|uniref:histidine phosphatase family protein n=1 Tax=Bacillus sp. OV322 TaxID=1882764 RepID=UPI0008E0BCBF|nr:histidine phosphatase family protein [Bacillus sp. OV322]SFC25182.1 2,3-bisphosphoglycerate-dependent phosphoglycerate mutase [Bacillus sp. OV322]